MFKSNERSEYSCIGLGDFFVFFFSRKSLTFCLRSILIFRGLTGNFFLVQCIVIVKRKANSTIEQKNVKVTKKRDRRLISKMEIYYQICQRKFLSSIDPVFSNCANLIKNAPIKICF